MSTTYREKPEPVLLAIDRDDRVALSIMGRHGASVTNRIKREKKEKSARVLERELEEMAHQANEDICPIDD